MRPEQLEGVPTPPVQILHTFSIRSRLNWFLFYLRFIAASKSGNYFFDAYLRQPNNYFIFAISFVPRYNQRY